MACILTSQQDALSSNSFNVHCALWVCDQSWTKHSLASYRCTWEAGCISSNSYPSPMLPKLRSGIHIQYTHAKNEPFPLSWKCGQFVVLLSSQPYEFNKGPQNADISYVTKDQRLRHYAFIEAGPEVILKSSATSPWCFLCHKHIVS